jgi:hypothetical protein
MFTMLPVQRRPMGIYQGVSDGEDFCKSLPLGEIKHVCNPFRILPTYWSTLNFHILL